ncbi:hypothetical protein DFH08DRAFT_951457 [Mycena albidolilacea]|uniref:Uncharacterized protein n=1 Tax=Mycena albidolilacea TaxID=1033008 RepID=A0AAD7AJI4_9AGAR|nr:hypothetical protein DFH08DRAFT_951457 [Mycena albidolilacea]
MNSLLVSTDSYLTDKQLCNHLESAMCHNLLDNYRANPITKAVDTTKLSLWLHEVKHIDNACLCGYNQMKAAVKEVEHKLNKHLAPTSENNRGLVKHPHLDGPSNSSSTSNNSVKCCPPLTEEEKIFDTNQGCCCCHFPFQMTHCSSGKTCPFPSANPYVRVTQKFVDAFCKGKGKENAPAAPAPATPTVLQ